MVLLAAALGASGAVMAQIIASIFTQRSERKRFEWEQAEAERRRNDNRLARFTDHKRDLYSRYLALHANFANVVRRQGTDVAISQESYFDNYVAFLDNEALLRQEITLLAPTLREPTNATLGAALRHYTNYVEHAGVSGPQYEAHHQAIRACRKAMSNELGIGEAE